MKFRLFTGTCRSAPAKLPPPRRTRLPIHRLLDLACCLLALPVLGVGILLMTLVVKRLSPGPVLFRQERVGYRGTRFLLLKFRTMHANSDPGIHQQHFRQIVATNAPMLKLDAVHDPRLLPGGWLLRATGLDELPQIINVLRGEMSLVGPRPCLPEEYAQYRPWQQERVNVVPGLTGLWQVSGKNRTTFDQMIRLDIYYARHASWWLNLKIILLTPWALAQQVSDTRRLRNAAHSAPTASALRSAPATLR